MFYVGDLLGVAEVGIKQPRVVEQPAVRRRAVGDEHPAFAVQERRDAPAAFIIKYYVLDIMPPLKRTRGNERHPASKGQR